MGDGALVKFGTALDAVNCAVDIQKTARAELDGKLRIGINSGDITIENDDVYGDGVNVAARLESIADPGGIYISESIEKAIRGQSNIQAKYLGEIKLKNVDYGVRTYALQGAGLPVPDLKPGKEISDGFLALLKQPGVGRVRIIAILIGLLLIAFMGHLAYNKYQANDDINVPYIEKSIAVLPFENRSNLEDDEFFTNGVHDDLLTQISKIREIKTISRTSVMEYRNTTKNARIIGEELGVATILEGGVQRAGNQIRINVQLIDTKTNAHLWAETYTRELSIENIFAIQSEIAQAIATALATVLSTEEKQEIEKLPTHNLAALEAYFYAKASSSKSTNEGFQEAINHLTSAIQLDSTFAIAYAELGELTLNKFWWAGLPIEEQIAKGKPLIEKAMKLDSNISEVQLAFGILRSYERDDTARELAYKKAIELNPNNADAYATYGHLFIFLGKNDQGIEFLFKAKELDPKNDRLGIQLANELIYTGRYDVARQIVEEIIDRKPNFSAAYRVLADIAVYGDYQLVEALQKIHKAIMLDPYYPANYMLSGWVYRELGENELAIRSFDQLLQIAPDFGGALLARGNIYELRSEPNKAFETYLLISEKSGWTKVLMFYLMEAGVKTNRSPEVIEHFREIYPSLFQADVLIDQSNYTSALALGRLLKAKGESGQAHHLLKGSLKVVQEETTSDWNSKVNNWEWESRVHLAMSNKEAALTSFVKLVAEGVYSDKIVRDPVYQLLYDESEFQRSMEIMKERLKEERAIVKEMEANGELDIPPLPNR